MRRAFCFSLKRFEYSVGRTILSPCCPGGYLRLSTGHLGELHLSPFKKSFSFSRLQSLHFNFTLPIYTLLRFLGRQPLCGIGVTSLMETTSKPLPCRARIAVSRPEPGPLTRTSISRSPPSTALRPAASAADWAANGVPFLVPLKPTAPEEEETKTFPEASAIVTMVLLKVALI